MPDVTDADRERARRFVMSDQGAKFVKGVEIEDFRERFRAYCDAAIDALTAEFAAVRAEYAPAVELLREWGELADRRDLMHGSKCAYLDDIRRSSRPDPPYAKCNCKRTGVMRKTLAFLKAHGKGGGE